MSSGRPLLPAPQGTASRSNVPIPTNVAPRNPLPKKKRNRHSLREWEEQKELFTILYQSNGGNLEDAAQRVKEERGFDASSRLWKQKVQEWRISKNFSKLNMQILIAKRDQRRSTRNVGTIFTLGGTEIGNERLDLFWKRDRANRSNMPSPSAPTPEGVEYYTPQSITDHSSPFEITDGIFLSQVEHHFQTIQPVITIKVERANSQLCSRCFITPLDEPEESPYYIRVKLVKGHDDQLLPSDSDSTSKSDDESTRPDDQASRPSTQGGQSSNQPVKPKIQPSRARITAREIRIKKATQQICWKCRKFRSLKVAQHRHRMGDLGIICRGRSSSHSKATKLLWQSRNLALNLRSVLCSYSLADERESTQPWSQYHGVPEIWIPPQALTDIGVTKLQRLLGFIRYSKLFLELFELNGPDQASWKRDWRFMSEAHGTGIETLARDLFGDPSVPYPEMKLATILIQFKLTSITPRPILLRLVLGIETKPEIHKCEACASDFMILDYMDAEAAVKIHVPLTRAFNIQLHASWDNFSRHFTTETCHDDSNWSEMGHHFQGWSEQALSTRAVASKKDKKFDETGGALHHEEFQPYSNDHVWEFWGGDLMSGNLCVKAQAEEETWNETGENSDESDDEFDPFLEQHDRRRKRLRLFNGER